MAELNLRPEHVKACMEIISSYSDVFKQLITIEDGLKLLSANRDRLRTVTEKLRIKETELLEEIKKDLPDNKLNLFDLVKSLKLAV